MIKTTYKDKLLDPRWQKKRLQILNRDNFTCQNCGSTKKTLHIHHFVYYKNGNPWDADDSDLITLCFECHEVKEFIKILPAFERDIFEFAFWQAYFRDCELEEKKLRHIGSQVEILNGIVLRRKREINGQ